MRRMWMTLPAVAAMLAVTACGSSSSSSSSAGRGGGSGGTTAAASSSGANVTAAKAHMEAYVGGPPLITLPKLKGAPPKGQTINYLTCPVAICTEVGTGVSQAAAALGWHVKSIQTNSTPSGYTQAWQQVDQEPGDGVVAVALLPDSNVESAIKAAKVPVDAVTDPSEPGPGMDAVIDSRADVALQGSLEADWVIQDAGKPVKSLFVYDPSLAAIATAYNGYMSEMAKRCPTCRVDVLKVSVAQIGPKLAQQVVSYLQSNTDVKYVAFGLGDLAAGVPAAIRAAGLQNQVKVITRAATTTNLSDIKSGGLAAGFTDETYEAGWRAVDSILRVMNHQSLSPCCKEPVGKIRLLTKANVPSNLSQPYTIPNYEAAFKKAWGLS